MFQTIIIVGNVGKPPEMRYSPAGKPITSFSVAVNREFTGADGQKAKETAWFRVTTWDKQAEICNQYVTKGMKVLVEGRLTCDPKTGGPKIWTRQDGTAGSTFEITASSVRFLSSSHVEDGTAPVQTATANATAASQPYDLPVEDDIPF